jgi:hypothetical protein
MAKDIRTEMLSDKSMVIFISAYKRVNEVPAEVAAEYGTYNRQRIEEGVQKFSQCHRTNILFTRLSLSTT